jgi:thioredoxin-related protein
MMRTHAKFSLVFLLVGFLAIPCAAADPAIQWHTDYATARKEAEKQKLPLMIVVSSDNCVYCRKMETSVFADAAVTKQLVPNFIALKIDAVKHPDFVKAMRVSLYPTTIMATSGGDVLAFLQGYIPADQFQGHTAKVLELAKAKQPAAPVTLTSRPKTNDPESPGIKPIPAAVIPQPPSSTDLLASARAAFKAERYGECLEHCESLLTLYKTSVEAPEAAKLSSEIRGNAERLAVAELQLDERNAANYVLLANTWLERGRPREAAVCLEKAIKLNPEGKHGEAARAKLAAMK